MTATATPQHAMVSPEIAEFCERAVEALREWLPVREVWLFGSHAEGKAKPHSDIDLFVVIEDAHGLKNPASECRAAIEAFKPRQRIDFHSLEERYWHHPRYRGFGLWADVLRKGICLYESGGAYHAPATDLPPMPGDPTVPDSWYEKARRDLKSAKVILEAEDIENALVLLQQSVEKLLKGWLVAQGWDLERTHALADLLAEAEARGASLGWFADDAEVLSKAFLLMRYPSDAPVPSAAKVGEIVARVERIFTQLGVTL